MKGIDLEISPATLKRDLSEMVADKLIETEGQGKAFKYFVSPTYEIFAPVNLEEYFANEVDERVIKENYNFELIGLLENTSLFTDEELAKLNSLQEILLLTTPITWENYLLPE